MRASAGTILAFLVGSMFVSLFYLSMGMDMTGGMTDCPFMSHEEVICPMDLADHIEAWKNAFLAVAPSMTLLLAVVGAVAFVAWITPHLFEQARESVPILHKQLRERTYTFSYRPLQELFSNGILHSKAF